MAEPVTVLGATGAVIQIASEGLKLSRAINDYIKRARLADEDIKEISHEVESTVILLQQFGTNLKLEEQTQVCSTDYYRATYSAVQDCETAFEEIEAILPPAILGGDDGENKTANIKTRDRVRWPFKQTKIAVLKAKLDRLKPQLNLMLLVMRHARELHESRIAHRYAIRDFITRIKQIAWLPLTCAK
jgi:predicted membrane-bound spermidine synthase